MYSGAVMTAIALIGAEAWSRKGPVCGAATGTRVPIWVGGWARHMRPTISRAMIDGDGDDRVARRWFKLQESPIAESVREKEWGNVDASFHELARPAGSN
jgi:hypothetical protein